MSRPKPRDECKRPGCTSPVAIGLRGRALVECVEHSHSPYAREPVDYIAAQDGDVSGQTVAKMAMRIVEAEVGAMGQHEKVSLERLHECMKITKLCASLVPPEPQDPRPAAWLDLAQVA